MNGPTSPAQQRVMSPSAVGDIPLAEGRFVQAPAAAPPTGRPGAGSPVSTGVRSSDSTDAAEYSENARLVGSSALSDDGMTPLIQVGPRRRRRPAPTRFAFQSPSAAAAAAHR